MNINITGRHFEVSDALRAKVQTRITDMLSEFPRMDGVHVVLNKEKVTRQEAEVVVHVPHYRQVEARAESHDIYASLDEAVEKVAVQLRRWADRVADHKQKEHLGVVDKGVQSKARS